jgi:threonine dehydrogenase-like Zn-dependent dehydrogenase
VAAVVADRAGLDQGSELHKKFRDRQDGCVKVVMNPTA